MKKHIFMSLLCGVLPVSALAANATLKQADNQVGVAFSYLHQSYGEFNDGLSPSLKADYLDTERGNLSGVALNYTAMGDALYGELNLGANTGDTGYTGYVQNLSTGALTPATTTTRNTITEFNGKLGWPVDLTQSALLIPNVELGARYWRRTVGVGTSLASTEDYRHYYAGIGLIGQYAPIDGLVLKLSGLLGRTFGAHISGGSTINEELGAKPLYRAGLGADYRLPGGWHLNGGVDYLRFAYGQSNLAPTGFIEPRSTTENVSYKIGVAYAFD